MNEGEGALSELEVHAIVRGRVQGVGFRATTQHHAQRLGLRGSVKNLPNGTVEIYVQGAREDVRQLFDALRGDAGLGRVDDIATDEGPPRKEYEGFHIAF